MSALPKLRTAVQQVVNGHQAVQPYTRIGSRWFWLENLLLLWLCVAIPTWVGAVPFIFLVYRAWMWYKKLQLPPSTLKLVHEDVTMPPDSVLTMMLTLAGKDEEDETARVLALEWIARHPQSGLYTATQLEGLTRFWQTRV